MTRLALLGKCGGLGASGLRSWPCSEASKSARMPGNSSEPPTRERSACRRVQPQIIRLVIIAEFWAKWYWFLSHLSHLSPLAGYAILSYEEVLPAMKTKVLVGTASWTDPGYIADWY